MPPLSESRQAAAGRRLKLLIVTDEMEVGGSQRQIVNLVRGLDRRRFDVSVAYFRNHSFFVDQLQAGGVRVVHIPKRGRIDARFLAALRRELRAEAYDIVHAFAFSAELWCALARIGLGAARRPQLVTSIRGTYDWYSPLQWQLKRWATAQSARVVANSRMGADFARRKMRLGERAIDVVYNGVTSEAPAAGARRALRQDWAVAGDDLVVLFVGRLVDVKDVSTLLRACVRLQAAAVPARLVVCGDGPQRTLLETQSLTLGLTDRVRFLGQRDDVIELIEAADVLVLPSRQEGLSNVILEAMRGARPVVASRTGGNVELVEPEATGLLFEVGDDAGLAAALQRLQADPALRARLGGAGAERVRQTFAVSAMVERFSEIYAEVCRRTQPMGVPAWNG